jgi:hypothetical protein
MLVPGDEPRAEKVLKLGKTSGKSTDFISSKFQVVQNKNAGGAGPNVTGAHCEIDTGLCERMAEG